MTSEAALQETLAGLLRRRRDLTQDEEAQRFAAAHIGGNDRVSPVEQLEIYREQFWLRHTGSLVEDFPAVGGLLGQARWERLVEEYLLAHEPRTFSLRDLGIELPDFVGSRAWMPERELVRDMARLEWAHIDVFDAAEAAPLSPQKVAEVPEDAWESARLVPHPSLRLLELAYPVLALRRRLLAAQAADEPFLDPLPESEPGWLAIHRQKRVILHDPLEAAPFSLLSKLTAGIALGAACESAASELGIDADTLAANLATWFSAWTARGYLVDIVV